MTKIEWCDETLNLWSGCEKVSPACTNCYAERMSKRLAAMGHKHYALATNDGKWTGKITLAPDSAWKKPYRWKKPRRIFVNSMTDTFHKKVSDEMLVRLFTLIEKNPQHTFMLLTKRAERMRECMREMFGKLMPPVNAWLGVTAENQEQWDKRVHVLTSIPARLHFVSMEPLLEFVDIFALRLPDWIIVGGESGPKPRTMEADWARRIRDDCQEAGVAFLMKQMSGKAQIPDDLMIKEIPDLA